MWESYHVIDENHLFLFSDMYLARLQNYFTAISCQAQISLVHGLFCSRLMLLYYLTAKSTFDHSQQSSILNSIKTASSGNILVDTVTKIAIHNLEKTK